MADERQGLQLTDTAVLHKVFSPETEEWFRRTLGGPTEVQKEAWPAIAAGKHTLVSAPTGTGKTLSAFLVFIDRLMAQAYQDKLTEELMVIYISPLKSLAGDIRENLKKPLEGIARIYEEKTGIKRPAGKKNAIRSGRDLPCPSRDDVSSARDGLSPVRDDSSPARDVLCPVRTAVRTGDTDQAERRRMIAHPPHILITTPESLYLMLTSISGQSLLKTARAVIIDELHALIDSKRGAHLMLTIARLDRLCGRKLQRIGLSATMEPLSTAAAYLAPEPAAVAAPKMSKEVSLQVESPFQEERAAMKDSVWLDLASAVYRHSRKCRTALVFLEGRMYAEKLAFYVNQIAGTGYARTHHGSLSKEQRLEAEEDLRGGKLRLLCATSSMELGIDVGDIDQVFQVGCPRTISGTMQRLGRAGHNPERVSVMYLFPRTAAEGISCGLTAELARRGGVELAHPPKLCLDVLAQHLVSMATGEGYEVDEVLPILKRAWPFQEVTRQDVCDVLSMLSGDYEHDQDIPVRPRVLYDRIHGRVLGDAYSRMLAVSTGGTIPDRGLYTVKTEEGVKLGELDEEYIYEARTGDKFLLGAFAWEIIGHDKDTVLVRQTGTEGARPPFWKGDPKGRSLVTGIEFGKLYQELFLAHMTGSLLTKLKNLGLDERAAEDGARYLDTQIEQTGTLPDHRTILIEHYRDKGGSFQMMVHSIFGKQVNAPLALLMQHRANEETGLNTGCVDEDNGFLLYLYGDEAIPMGLIKRLSVGNIKETLSALLYSTPLFNITFRYNAARALMMGVRKRGRQPLWVQRMRGAEMMDAVSGLENHPLIRETARECLNDQWDIEGVEYVLSRVLSGDIKVHEFMTDKPSPMSLPLQWQVEAQTMYDYAPSSPKMNSKTEKMIRKNKLIKPEPGQLKQVSARVRLPEDTEGLHSLLMMEGDLAAGELEVPLEWLIELEKNGRAEYIEPGLWIAAEHRPEYENGLEGGDEEARLKIFRRSLRYQGARTAEQMAERYALKEEEVNRQLNRLCELEEAVVDNGIYYHAKLYEKARWETIKTRRDSIKTRPSESFAALSAARAYVEFGQMKQLLESMKGIRLPAAVWEGVIFPCRLKNYSVMLLDQVLTEGEYIWRLWENGDLSFHREGETDWDCAPVIPDGLTPKEELLYEALKKRGASFMQSLSGVIEGESPHETLLSLLGRGLVVTDGFLSVRQWLDFERLKKAAAKVKAAARVSAMKAGRWQIARPLKCPSPEEQIEDIFRRSVILCRETAQGYPSSFRELLDVVKIWEYTGRARRGYFVKGLSGAQFIKSGEFELTAAMLANPEDLLVWLPAVDPAQVWGKALAHMPKRAFLNVPGTAVCLYKGLPAAVFEQQGKSFRLFEEEKLSEALQNFVRAYQERRIFPGLNRLVVKKYPECAGTAFREAGFMKEITDYVLYRG